MENKKVNSEVDRILRKKAEEKLNMLKGQEPHSTEPLTMDAAIKRIYELEVQKFELEIRNEELVIAKENTEQEKEIFKEIFDFATFAYLSVSKEGEILAFNFAATQMLGKEGRELTKSSLHLFISQETLADYHLFLQKIFSTHTKQTCEVTLAYRGNTAPALSPSHVDVNIDGIISQNGEYCYLTLTDITERKKAEEKLKTSDRIFKHSLDMLCIAGFDGYFKVLNPAWTKTLGWSVEDLLSNPWIKFVHPDDRNETKNIKSVIVDGQEIFQFENRYICKDGSVKWLSWNSFPYPEENIMFGVARDVTASKQRELVINNFFEQPLNLNLIADFDGKINRANSAWEIVLGYKKHDITGSNFFDFIHPEDIAPTIEEMKKLQKGISTLHFENRYRHKNGKYRTLAWSSITSLYEQLVYAVAIDITDLKQAQQIKHELDVSRKSAIFKQNFLANMSHEIRTPLTGVLGMVDILEQTPLSEEQKDYLKTLKNSGENLREIINQVLDYSKIEAGKVSIRPIVFEFRSFLHDAKNLFKYKQNKDIKIKIVSHDQIPDYIIADRLRLSQILNNLTSNALKFTKEGSVTIRSAPVSINAKSNELVIKVEVTDTGIGIPVCMQKKLFIPFSQIEAADIREYEGTGLGLSICKQLVELMGGKIGVISQEGKGSTFWFTFTAFMAEGQLKNKKLEANNTPNTKNLHILLVEDKVVNQKVIGLMLNSLGHSATIACNGKRALELYQPGKFNLILMDIQMPVMDGITATQKLKEEYQILPPIVGLSANAFEGDRPKYMALGMDEYLTKPVKKEDFNGLIRKLF
jgi:PAS domain S-box-containing protein